MCVHAQFEKGFVQIDKVPKMDPKEHQDVSKLCEKYIKRVPKSSQNEPRALKMEPQDIPK